MSAPLIFTPEYYQRMRDLETGGWWNAAMRDVAAHLLRRFPLPERGLLLDVGCGSGQSMAWFLADHPGWRAIGLDVSEHGLASAAEHGLAVHKASALELPIPSGSVDLILCLDVLQHLPLDGGDRRSLAEMRRVLRPGGIAFLRTNAQAFPATTDDPIHQFHKYRTDELRSKIRLAGLEPVRISRINALLGLAEIPRELRMRDREGSGYHGILAAPRDGGRLDALKQAWLRGEGRLVAAGIRLPAGRTLLAVCRAP